MGVANFVTAETYGKAGVLATHFAMREVHCGTLPCEKDLYRFVCMHNSYDLASLICFALQLLT